MEFERCKGRAYYQEYPEGNSGREVLCWEDAMDEEGDMNGPGRRGRGRYYASRKYRRLGYGMGEGVFV
jgi:hypothetical protein